MHQHHRVSEPQTCGFGWMGFSLWYPLQHSDGSPGHVSISAAASPCGTEETKPGSRDLEENKEIQLLWRKPAFTHHRHTAVQSQKGGPSHPGSPSGASRAAAEFPSPGAAAAPSCAVRAHPLLGARLLPPAPQAHGICIRITHFPSGCTAGSSPEHKCS